ncbi:hypothetical protein WICPIJ_001462 [Wickerhamomyces pijperi]|uniref:Needs CLA4 to survive protein 3 n=1 Tax=Wickerhamomyces pijperi TaxID=599730 RepID=A0A9P8TR44_WICPI|nr:hypothetical protein WICPIJ_001462 [Wickerhamomyces pijperi]
MSSDITLEQLKERLAALELENTQLKSELSSNSSNTKPAESSNTQTFEPSTSLTLEEYTRYGRQLTVSQFQSIPGQLSLKNSKILVIGAGGLGCPALLYLTGAGVGKIGIVDDDVVDISNVHRQVLHDTTRVGWFKAESAEWYLRRLNPNVDIQTYCYRLDPLNAFDIFQEYDLILDCTDSPHSRYLINDVACLTGKTIVSGSGVRTEGQLSILNFRNSGPCYRCFYPSPPPPNSVTSCKDGGVIGPVIGLVGVMMALEAIKVLTGWYTEETFKPFLGLYSGYDGLSQSWKCFKMRGKKKECIACGDASNEGKLTRELIQSGAIDYEVWCGVINYNVLKESERITAGQYADILGKFKEDGHVLLDVRPKEHFSIVHLPHSTSLPLDKLRRISDKAQLPFDTDKPVYTICRYGNDSQYATRYLNDTFGFDAKDVKGGLYKWSMDVDDKFPTY